MKERFKRYLKYGPIINGWALGTTMMIIWVATATAPDHRICIRIPGWEVWFEGVMLVVAYLFICYGLISTIYQAIKRRRAS